MIMYLKCFKYLLSPIHVTVNNLIEHMIVRLPGCYILCSESLVEVDRLGVKVEGWSDRPGNLKLKVIDNKSRGQFIGGRVATDWRPNGGRLVIWLVANDLRELVTIFWVPFFRVFPTVKPINKACCNTIKANL